MTPNRTYPEYSFRLLRVFVAVAECGSISKAAQRLYRAQSAVTRSIHELERAVGGPLFERHPAGMSLTDMGRVLLRRARRAAAEFDEARRDVLAFSTASTPARNASLYSMQVANARLAAFVMLTELHHMPAVAQQLGLTQPAVSAAVRSLEESLQTKLFERTSRGLFPTPAASALAVRAKLAFAELRHGAEEIEALRGVTRGHVRVGILALSRSAVIVPRAVAGLARAQPDIRVSLVEGSFAMQELALRSGELDFVFGALRTFPPGSDFVGEPLLEDSLSVVVRAGHPLAAARRVSLRQLAGYQWVLNHSGTPGRERLEATFHARRLELPRVMVETGSLAMTLSVLLETDLLTALSRHQVEPELRAGMVAVLPMELPLTRRSIGIIRRKGSVPSPSAALLASEIRKIVADLRSGVG